MIKTITTSTLVGILGMTVCFPPLLGQVPAHPAPRQPVLPRMPETSSWTITFQYVEEQKPPRPDSKESYLGDVPRSVVVTKVKNTYREQMRLASGKQVERWDWGGTQFTNAGDGGSIFLVAPPSEEIPDDDYYDRRKSDFPELNWISLSNYRGIQEFNGRKAFLFEYDRDGKKMSALLSVEEQRPLTFFDGFATRTYAVNPPPSGALVPPQKFSDAYNRHKKAMEALKYRPGLP